jgi:hypothetical protein
VSDTAKEMTMSNSPYTPQSYQPQNEQPTTQYPSSPPQPYYGVPEEFQRRQDEDNLRLLSIFHYVLGGLTILGSSIFIIHLVMGIAMLVDPTFMNSKNSEPAPAFAGWMFTIMGGGAVLLGWTLGILTIHAGRCLTRRKSYTLAFVLACLNCLHAPIGTALGIFTIIVLSRPSVKALFGVSGPGPEHPQSPSPGQPWYRG